VLNVRVFVRSTSPAHLANKGKYQAVDPSSVHGSPRALASIKLGVADRSAAYSGAVSQCRFVVRCFVRAAEPNSQFVSIPEPLN
jgi:hypothetical protein